MKKLLLTTFALSFVLMNCAPKEDNKAVSTRPTPPRNGGPGGAGGPMTPEQQKKAQEELERRKQEQEKAGDAKALANLERFSAHLGFYDVTDKEIPQPVRDASASVFKIVSFSAEEGNDTYEVIKKSVLRQNEAEFKARVNKITNDIYIQAAMMKQIDGCLNSKIAEDKECTILLKTNVATAFLAGDGQTLWTNAHVVEGLLKTYARFESKSVEQVAQEKRNLLIYVFDSKNGMVFEPFTAAAQISELPAASVLSKEKFYGPDTDYIAISLSKEIGRPLQWSKKLATMNVESFVVGYPSCTNCEAPDSIKDADERLAFTSRAPKKDSSGQGLIVTRGRVLFVDDTVIGFYKTNKETIAATIKSVLHYTADSNYGQSGSPVLNSSGEVIAIHRGGKSRKFNDKHYRISNGVMPAGIYK